MTNRIVFLDIDGVLCTPRAALAQGDFGLTRQFDPVAVAFLNRLYEAAPYAIVVSSTWRAEEGIPIVLAASGVHAPCAWPEWRTGHDDERPEQIASWLRHFGADVGSYLILDDDSFKWTEEQHARWVKCDCHDGIPLMAMQKALDLFEAEWPQKGQPFPRYQYGEVR